MKSLKLFIFFTALTCTSISYTKKDRDKEDSQEAKTSVNTQETVRAELVPVNRSHEWLKFLWNGSSSIGLVVISYLMLSRAIDILNDKRIRERDNQLKDTLYLGAYAYTTNILLDAAYNKYISSIQSLKKAWDGFAYAE